MNSGKKFENAFKASVPSYCLYYRLHDPPQSFQQSSTLRFSWRNPCDCFIFDSKSSLFYTLELKSTKNSSISFEDINEKGEQPSRMIHKHQIEALLDYSKFENVCSGFIFNFREENNQTETTYFQPIDDFLNMTGNIGKKSFNRNNLKHYGALDIKGCKKRINYTWDIESFLAEINLRLKTKLNKKGK